MMRDRRLLYLVLLLAAAMIVCTGSAILISVRLSEHAIEVSEQGQCDSLQADIDAYREEPPTTKAGRHQVTAKQARFVQLRCPEGK